ncbi:MAG: alpha/beta hydrolase family protein [Anaerobacillus sp.]|uniref:alpha/beta hydrolase family protein n=1 Tax=Anaerobacillus sp. TaxID=1872506 RepID=UPI0039196ECB
MGVIILLVLIVNEMALAAYSIMTKSMQQKVRNMIRIIAFVGFVLFSALSVIDWSFRYYTIAGVLFPLAIIGAVGLLKKKEDKRTYKPVRVVMKTIGMTLLFIFVALPSIIFPQYEAINPTGNYQVKTATCTYIDINRIETYTNTGENRKLNVRLWYPENTERSYPLIVFSHGGLGLKTSNETLFNELASHGYVVGSIDHTFHSLFTTDENGQTTYLDKGYMKELTTENAKLNKQQSFEFYQKWMQVRTDDLNFVIDYILGQAMNDTSDEVYNLVDTTKIGVIGHSLGGSAALGIGRIRKDVSAVIALESPFMVDIIGVNNDEFVFTDEEYSVPLLNVYSDSSWPYLGEWSQYAQNYHLLSNTNPIAFNVHISGVGHFTLTDLALTSPFFTRMFNGQKSMVSTESTLKLINKLSLEFFDCFLKGEGKFSSDGTY